MVGAYVWLEGSRRSVTKVDEIPPGPMMLQRGRRTRSVEEISVRRIEEDMD